MRCWPVIASLSLLPWPITMLGFALALCVPPAGFAQAPPAKGKVACEAQAQGYDSLDVRCPVTGSGKARHYRFKANFSGGHDDTQASITPVFDERALACEPGSKPSLMGEDGDVSVDCAFSVDEKDGSRHLLKVKIWWSHAQYTDFAFIAE